MTPSFNISDRVRVMADVPNGTNRTPFFIREKQGVVVYYHGPAGNPRDLSYGGSGEPKIPLYSVSFHMAHLYDQDPEFVRDRILVDVWEDWLEPVPQGPVQGPPIDRDERELTYYEWRVNAITSLLAMKGLLNGEETQRLVAEHDFRETGATHPMVPPGFPASETE